MSGVFMRKDNLDTGSEGKPCEDTQRKGYQNVKESDLTIYSSPSKMPQVPRPFSEERMG